VDDDWGETLLEQARRAMQLVAKIPVKWQKQRYTENGSAKVFARFGRN